MAYDERLAERVRGLLAEEARVEERKMFGGLAFLVGGHMACGVEKNRLMLRIGPEGYEEALTQAHVRPMDFTGRPLRGFVYVEPEGLRTRPQLARWVRRAVAFARTQPPKKGSARTGKAAGKGRAARSTGRGAQRPPAE